MVLDDDCPCADETEASNITSLLSDTTLEEFKQSSIESDTGQKNNPCQEDLRSCRHCGTDSEAPIEREKTKRTEKSREESSRNETSNEQSATSTACLCGAHKVAYTLPVKYKKDAPYSRPFWCRFKWKWPRKEPFEKRGKPFKLSLQENQCPHYTKPFMCCEITELPERRRPEPAKPRQPNPAKEWKPREKENRPTERIDVYYFDHGNSAYYRTTDCPPILVTERCAERTDQAATRFWAEIFGTIHIGTAFITAFILQLFRFVLFSLVRPLTVGLLQLLADYFIKPLLSIVFNALIQPVLILLYNVATSFKDLCEPLAQAVGFFLKEIANLCASVRLVEIKRLDHPTSCT